MRLGVATVAICLAIVGLSAAQNASAAMNRKPTNIPAQPLGSALESLAKERDLQVIYRSDIVQSIQSVGAVGVFTPDEALTKLLSGTGLTYRYLNETTVTILPVSSSGGSGESPNQPPAGPPPTSSTQKEPANSGTFLLAQATSGSTRGDASLGQSAESISKNKSGELQEVVVTAEKRAERVQDVPVPVTALNADILTENNQLRIQDYYNTIPNFVVTPAITSAQFLSIRGITTGGFNTPTVGVLIDDVPFTTSDRLLGNIVPDIDPNDLARIEVLRGPQGTLYGASSLGGLLKFVTIDPSPSALSGRIQAGTSTVENGHEWGTELRGAVNVPLGDTFAIRASGFDSLEPGYITNPVLNLNGVNTARDRGGHVAALWQPSDWISIKLSALYQETKGDGADLVETGPGLGDLQQNDKGGTGWYDRKVQAYSAVVKAKLGEAELTSVTGYNINYDLDSLDLLGGPFSVISEQRDEKFTQELRLSGPLGPRWDGLLGVYYTREASDPFIQTGYFTDASSGALGAQIFQGVVPWNLNEYAAFTDLTYHFTDRFDIQVGGRESRLEQTQTDVEVSGAGTVSQDFKADANVFTYLLTPRFRISPDLMAYARVASGYRAGGANVGPIAARGLPGEYDPDKTKNYEIGIKGDVGPMFSYDASVFYIDWNNIQLQLISAPAGAVPITYITNGGSAKSQGLELSIEARPLDGLTLGAWATWTDAVLTEDFPADSTAYGLSGDRLPNTSRFSANFSADQTFPVGRRMMGSVGGSLIYVGDRVGVFGSTAAPQRADYPSYVEADLRAGLQFDAWKANLYVNNVSDKRGLIGGGVGSTPPTGFFYIRPRTIGLSITRTF